jgi:LysR family transcriptional regulator, glycine cleavage system transcriptional activator
MNYEHVDFRRDRIAVAIRNSAIPPPEEVDVQELAAEEIGAVCAPEYAAPFGLQVVDDLSKVHRLASKTRPHAWADWARAVGKNPLAAQESFDHFYLLIQAAVCGLGVAVVPRMLVQGDLQSGKLVAPFGFVPGDRKLVLWSAPRLASRPELKRLVSWLAAELEASNATPVQALSSPG